MKKLIIAALVTTLAIATVGVLGCGGNSSASAVTGLMQAMASGNSSAAESYCVTSKKYGDVQDEFSNHKVTSYTVTSTQQAGTQEVYIDSGNKELPSVIVKGKLTRTTEGETTNESCAFRLVNDGGTWKVYGVEGPSF